MSWTLKSKTPAGSWSNNTKTATQTPAQRILTPDGSQILVGENEDQVLIWAEATTEWNQQSKNASGSWTMKQKV